MSKPFRSHASLDQLAQNRVFDAGPKGQPKAMEQASDPAARGYPLTWEVVPRSLRYDTIATGTELQVLATTRLHHGADVYISSPVPNIGPGGITLRLYGRSGNTGKALLGTFNLSGVTQSGQSLLALSTRQACEFFEVTLEVAGLPITSEEILELVLIGHPIDAPPRGENPTAHRAVRNDVTGKVSVQDLQGYPQTFPLEFLGADIFSTEPAGGNTLYLNIYEQSGGPAVAANLRHCYALQPQTSQQIRVPHSAHVDSRLQWLYCTVTSAPLGAVGPVFTGSILGTVYVQ